MKCLKENCIHQNVCALYTFSGYNTDECGCYEYRPHGSWEGQPQRRNLVIRVCTSCGELSAVGNFCMWCGSNNQVEVGDTNDKTFNKR